MPDVPYRIQKPLGYDLVWARTDRYVGKPVPVKPGPSLRVP